MRRLGHFPLLAAVLLAVVPHPAHPLTELETSQIRRFQDYLRICTAHPAPDYAGAAAFLLPYAASLGLSSKTLHFSPCKSKPLLLLTWPGTDPSLPSILLNSHLDSVPAEPAARRGLQAACCAPARPVHVSLVPDEEIGGEDGHEKFVQSEEFRALNVGFMLDEGQASLTDVYRVFYADRLVWKLIVKATGAPGHGSKLFDGAAVENLMDCIETVAGYRDAQFEKVKSGKYGPGEVVSVNPVYMNAGTPSPTVRILLLVTLLAISFSAR
ncbi:hypothetical protein TRIUR3_14805 [Triticum urartu]|uniref:Aminoacylase-1 n=1 Tax=Triticum urartu TaxID=4572 RepID=M8A4D2_TRIUA|nr:hypothetical protein TRIUR3_14805 [Triticum urartu]